MATRVYLGVGSNLNKENALRFAVAKIGPLFKNFEKSSVWVSHAIRAGEPDYYNMVFGGDTEASLEDLYGEKISPFLLELFNEDLEIR